MKRLLIGSLAVVPMLLAAAFVAWKSSPWPSAWLIGRLMEDQGDASAQALARHVPAGVASRLDLRYGAAASERFDLFRRTDARVALPAIVWVHGGGFISGNKEAVANYLRILAAHGYAAVGLEYATGRGHAYPQPVQQVNAALGHLVAHAADLGIDSDRLALAGDSAGAQIAAQVALLTVDHDYAQRLGIAPAIGADRLRAMLLVSGAFDLSRIRENRNNAWVVDTFLWAYTGKRDYLDDPRVRLASINQQVAATFPPSFIASGNGDPLEPQARRLVTRLDELGVPTVGTFFPADHAPSQPHEFQFDLDTPEGTQTLAAMLAFLRAHTGCARDCANAAE